MIDLGNITLRSRSLPIANLAISVWQRSPMLSAMGLLLLALMLPTLLLYALDSRLLQGVNVWTKPLKFQLSLGTYFLTLAWFVGYSRDEFSNGRQHVWFASVLALAACFEVAYITFQAAVGEMSHFNIASPLHSIMYSLMGLGAVTLATLPLWLAVMIGKNASLRVPSSLRFGIVVGLVLTSILGLVSGVTISAFNGPVIGAVGEQATYLWFLGWSFNAGDLRVAHFMGLHLMQLIPLAAWLLVTVRVDQAYFWTVTVTLLLLTVWLLSYAQALAGIPFWSLNFWSLNF